MTDNYLGSAAVVTRLVGEFCASAEALAEQTRSGVLDAAQAKAELGAQIRRVAAIFGGSDTAFDIIKGWNDVSLPARLMADLGPFWRMRRGTWGNDAIAVLFDWLASLVIEKSVAAQGDDLLLGAMLKPSIQYAVTVLLGIDKRAG